MALEQGFQKTPAIANGRFAPDQDGRELIDHQPGVCQKFLLLPFQILLGKSD